MRADPRFGPAVAREYDATRSLPLQAVETIQQQVIAAARLNSDSQLLEVGAGTGALSKPLLARGFSYVGADSSLPMLQQFVAPDNGRPALVQADMLALPFRPDCFDTVLAFRVFGVVPGWRRGVRECLRVLKPGGHLVVGRVERPPDSLHSFVRDRRNEWLTQRGVDAGRPGGGDGDVLRALAAEAEQEPPPLAISWSTEVTPEDQINANLSGWRIHTLDIETRQELHMALKRVLAEHYGELDLPIEEMATFALHSFRKSE